MLKVDFKSRCRSTGILQFGKISYVDCFKNGTSATEMFLDTPILRLIDVNDKIRKPACDHRKAYFSSSPGIVNQRTTLGNHNNFECTRIVAYRYVSTEYYCLRKKAGSSEVVHSLLPEALVFYPSSRLWKNCGSSLTMQNLRETSRVVGERTMEFSYLRQLIEKSEV